MLYHIFTDASADLDPAFVLREDIRVIPMVYTVGDMTRTYAGVAGKGELEEYYDGQRRLLPSGTTQINPQNYVDAFRPYCEKGDLRMPFIMLYSGVPYFPANSANL